ncbi:glycosyltransferase family 2 protein [Leeuwenhoekiella palythoae]|uniref:glycosyltransferase family 2 protein n=1 Tax=Leeuwenhoekiella palythoae TaxID=573501 RepID=UPI000C463AC4|nr:glycosyltransferase family A protein [Leeuwenhoekiella palythoae]MBH12474.1 glycosyl transferase [Leeuwenhoekiella sp.]UBZ11862.1 glycosyltransferase family 2 protein [Leeuwenhoekiella palythoae]|tara:strand:+ start:214 stop:984 length:771 start_codon:yes stop_codon:yes gene_type:complete
MAIKKPIDARPLVSIVTPSYNSEKYIAETIASVQQQTVTDWELLIVDDASSDATVTKIKRLQAEDSRIKCFSLKENKGPAHARNLGIQKARGKYLTFLDADDLWFPEFLERSSTEAKMHPFVFASYKRLDENLEPYLSDFIVPEKVSYTDILKSNSISCLTAFLDIEVLGKKYMPLIKKRQDMGLWLQYLKKTNYAYGIQEPLAIYRIRRDSLSRNKTGLIKHQWKFYREVEQLSVFASAYYLTCWAYKGFVKYRS